MNDQVAIRRLKQGDISGLEWLVDQYQLKAVRAAFLIARDTQLAEDIVQESFINAFQHIHQFDEDRPFKPWFMRSVVNRAVKTVSRQAKHISDDLEFEHTSIEDILAGEGRMPEETLEFSEFQKQVWDAIGQLSPRQRAAVVYHYFLDMSGNEIADELDAAPGTVKWLLHTARHHLRDLLNRERKIP